MPHSRDLSPLALACLSFAASAQQPEDPAPPKVVPLGDAPAPDAREHARLKFHKAPKPLPKGAKTQDWPTFLGPDRTGVSKETKLLKEWPADGPQLVWEMERGASFQFAGRRERARRFLSSR